ncbi:ribonuclease HI [Actinoalloteichus hoggarensis]|uniref:Ribonuclease H n=1 Tax=Actinoalloteichus hoggarensis TaxID=1470176 RepID=A0A221W6D6_9PSEU|nr:Ribonuclease HI [Actinoalloteichus hoggarensis]MBB5922047.1 ribonuclease HI [Actinoalloteichus hoggarensis]
MPSEDAEQIVEIYTDGACSPNPGPGGWGAVLRYGRHERELYGSESAVTTNNRMELTAPLRALESLTRPAVVRLYTDSTYVKNGVTQWVHRWKSNGWQTSAREPVKNADLWRELDAATARHRVEWHWVKGHAGHPDNERADRLAVQGVREARGIAVGQDARPPAVPSVAKPAAKTRGAARTDAEPKARCQALTRSGKDCPTVARPSGLCHVHDPAVRCGAITKGGKPCAVATGGGRCERHARTEDVASGLF